MPVKAHITLQKIYMGNNSDHVIYFAYYPKEPHGFRKNKLSEAMAPCWHGLHILSVCRELSFIPRSGMSTSNTTFSQQTNSWQTILLLDRKNIFNISSGDDMET